MAGASRADRRRHLAALGAPRRGAAIAEGSPHPEPGAPATSTAALIGWIERLLDHYAPLLQHRDVALALCRLVQQRPAEPWSESTIHLIQRYTELPVTDPAHNAATGIEEAVTEAPPPETTDEEFEDLNVAALDSLAGAATAALMRLMAARPEVKDSCLPIIERLASDPDAVSRIAAQGLCAALLRRDRDRAVELFVRSCDHHDDRVLAGMYVPDFLGHTWRGYAPALTPVVARMVGSALPHVAERGAFWATVGHIAAGLYSELAASSLQGNAPQRKGAANALAQLAREPEWRQTALPGLIACFADDEPKVVAQAIAALRNEAVLGSPEGPALATAFVQSPAFASHA
jgi:hypothetical protein